MPTTVTATRAEHGTTADRTFRAMGCDMRIAVVPRAGASDGDADAAVERAAAVIHGADLALSRFDPLSELRQLDADARERVTVSRLSALALDHARDAAVSTGGLLDPTLAPVLDAAGYDEDWDPQRRVALPELLAAAPRRRSASAAPSGAWRQLHVDRATRTISRPPGLRLDLGATAKGLVADLALRAIGAAHLAIVDVAGDLALGGDWFAGAALPVRAADPFGGPDLPLQLRAAGGLATSSIAGRCWMRAGEPGHHLLDPSTGRPAFTGVVQVTAAAPTGAHAEVIAGHALLAGPAAAAHLVGRYGGAVVHDDGRTDVYPGDLLTPEPTL